ncbi:MAG: aminoacyl-tRNA hydrolase [Patescibacteria group bacterium]
MYLIVGLGNPGRKYLKTRHNAGFQAVDFLVEAIRLRSLPTLYRYGGQASSFKNNKKLKSEILETQINNQKVIIAKPQTFMNNSGVSVAYATKKHNIPAENIIIIYDELDLPFGEIRVRQEGYSAGHNGIKSIIQHLGTDKFNRIRIGISNEYKEKMPTDPIKLRNRASKFVLKKFSRAEQKELKETILPQVLEKIQEII